jgi:type IV secretion system protein VirB9
MTARVRSIVVAVAAVLAGISAHAEVMPAPGVKDTRVRVVGYEADEVYRLPAFVGYQVHLQFAPDEHFVGLASGDVEGLSFVAEGSHLFLKPKAARVATNLTVLTDRRTYQFEYSALARRPDPAGEDVIYSLRFTYPAPPTVEPVKPIEPDFKAAAASRAKNFEYVYAGDAALQPIAAWDDGVHVHLRFAARAELPALFVQGGDGAEQLVNVSVEGEEVIVQRLAEHLIVRRGRLAGCLLNRAFAGAGERLPSGTLAPEVSRRTKGGAS